MITLTHRAQQQLTVLHALDRGELCMAEAADLLGLSIRQVRRLRRTYQRRGLKALVHGNRGRRSARRLADALCERVITLAKTIYRHMPVGKAKLMVHSAARTESLKT